MSGVGQIAFIERNDIDPLFSNDWSISSIELRKYIKNIMADDEIHSEWLVVAEK